MKRILAVVLGLAVVLVGALLVRRAVHDDRPPLVITHWSNSHPMREGLMPEMAAAFNDGDHRTSSGQRIEVVVVSCDSADQIDDLASRAKGTGAARDGCDDSDGTGPAADPTIVTPQSSDWLVDLDQRVGEQVVDVGAAAPLAETWLGIVTYREMAECLGWPDRAIGYADIVALSADPQGWAAHPDCARSEWGQRPLLAFTNPRRSTSGRNVLVTLYSVAAHKSPADLTVADVERAEVVDYVKDFQQLVKHYFPTTISLNTKVRQGPRFGQFFLMPEDNLVSLATGKEQAIAADGTTEVLDATDELVMIYPTEGSVLNANPAGIVRAPWVTAEQAEAAGDWVSFLRADEQQRKFMDAGFRPAAGTGLSVDAQRFAAWGLDPARPTATIEPGDLRPEVLAWIIDSWDAVRKPAIVTFVVDTSGSMSDGPLEQVKDGLARLLDTIASGQGETENQVGLVTFSSDVDVQLGPRPVSAARFPVADAIDQMEASGDTALYDAVEVAVALTDQADGDPLATRAVVVLSDGAATKGRCLDTLISMRARDERAITSFCGMQGDSPQVGPVSYPVEDVGAEHLLHANEHDVQVFFLGFGDADGHIGRLLAEATGADYQGSTSADLATVIAELSGYF